MPFPASVLPVIDLMHGQVVHARLGCRSQYQPLVSQWCDQAHDPLALTNSLYQRFSIDDFYLADLNALEGSEPQRDIISRLIHEGYHLRLDAGVRSVNEAEQWLALGVGQVVIASETLPSYTLLQELFRRIRADRLVFSLDLIEGRLRSMPDAFPNNDTMAVIDLACESGCYQFIVLDTATVGVSKGPTTLHLCRQIRDRFSHCHVISGGGVRNRADIQQLEHHGVERVLISTWLHQGCP